MSHFKHIDITCDDGYVLYTWHAAGVPMSKQGAEKVEPISSRVAKNLTSSIDKISRLRKKNRGEIAREGLKRAGHMRCGGEKEVSRR